MSYHRLVQYKTSLFLVHFVVIYKWLNTHWGAVLFSCAMERDKSKWQTSSLTVTNKQSTGKSQRVQLALQQCQHNMFHTNTPSVYPQQVSFHLEYQFHKVPPSPKPLCLHSWQPDIALHTRASRLLLVESLHKLFQSLLDGSHFLCNVTRQRDLINQPDSMWW